MTIISHAQNFEDVLLWRALGDVDQGRYLDIGAQDPVHDSVSLVFYEAGWRGTHVEPTPTYAAKLREAPSRRDRYRGGRQPIVGYFGVPRIPGHRPVDGQGPDCANACDKGFQGRKILVPTVRLDQLLEQTGEVQWMKVDVEGMEADVLASWGDNPARPWVIVIEATVPNSQILTDHEWRDLLIERGYCHVHFDGLSRYFVHESHAELKSRLAAPANVFDQFVVGRRHFSASMVHADLEKAEQRVRDQAAEVVRLNEELLATTHRLQREQRERELALRQIAEAYREVAEANAAAAHVREELNGAQKTAERFKAARDQARADAEQAKSAAERDLASRNPR